MRSSVSSTLVTLVTVWALSRNRFVIRASRLFRGLRSEKVAPAGSRKRNGRLCALRPMAFADLSRYYDGLLAGSYDRADLIVLDAYSELGYPAGGFRPWWRRLQNGSKEELDNTHQMRRAGRFSRRVRGFWSRNALRWRKRLCL